jgi:hypothetical protein
MEKQFENKWILLYNKRTLNPSIHDISDFFGSCFIENFTKNVWIKNMNYEKYEEISLQNRKKIQDGQQTWIFYNFVNFHLLIILNFRFENIKSTHK